MLSITEVFPPKLKSDEKRQMLTLQQVSKYNHGLINSKLLLPGGLFSLIDMHRLTKGTQSWTNQCHAVLASPGTVLAKVNMVPCMSLSSNTSAWYSMVCYPWNQHSCSVHFWWTCIGWSNCGQSRCIAFSLWNEFACMIVNTVLLWVPALSRVCSYGMPILCWLLLHRQHFELFLCIWGCGMPVFCWLLFYRQHFGLNFVFRGSVMMPTGANFSVCAWWHGSMWLDVQIGIDFSFYVFVCEWT